MSKGLFRVLRPFLLEGRPVQVDTLVRLDDVDLVQHLLTVGKITHGDEATRARIRTHHPRNWIEPKNTAITPGRDGVITRRL